MSKCSSIFIRWAKLVAHIFRMALARCTFTVTSLNPSSAAICLFRFPAATLAITSRSRPLRDSRCSRIVECNCCIFRRALSRSRAVKTASSRSWLRKGLVRKSTAPAFIAPTAIAMSPWPVTKTIGT